MVIIFLLLIVVNKRSVFFPGLKKKIHSQIIESFLNRELEAQFFVPGQFLTNEFQKQNSF
jgi:hypothetical protein